MAVLFMYHCFLHDLCIRMERFVILDFFNKVQQADGGEFIILNLRKRMRAYVPGQCSDATVYSLSVYWKK